LTQKFSFKFACFSSRITVHEKACGLDVILNGQKSIDFGNLVYDRVRYRIMISCYRWTCSQSIFVEVMNRTSTLPFRSWSTRFRLGLNS